jgi:hypothetical protein
MGRGGGGTNDAAAPDGIFQEAGKCTAKRILQITKSGFYAQQFLNY